MIAVGTAIEPVVAAGTFQAVIALGSEEPVGAHAAEEPVGAGPAVEQVCAAVAAHVDRYAIAGSTTVTSFDPVALEIVRRIAPALPRAFIGAYDTPVFLETALRLECRQADVPLKQGSPEVVRRAQAHGLRVVGWLGNTPDELDALVAWGVDGITTDYPTRAIAHLRDRGVSTADTWT